MDLAFTIDDTVAAKLAAALRPTLDNAAGLTDRQVIRRATRRHWRGVYAQAEATALVDAAQAQLRAAQTLLAQAQATADSNTNTAFGPDE